MRGCGSGLPPRWRKREAWPSGGGPQVLRGMQNLDDIVFTNIGIITPNRTVRLSSNHFEMKVNSCGYFVSKYFKNLTLGSLSSKAIFFTLGICFKSSFCFPLCFFLKVYVKTLDTINTIITIQKH